MPFPNAVQRAALRQLREFCSLRGGLRPQLRGSEGEPVLVEEVEPAPTSALQMICGESLTARLCIA